MAALELHPPAPGRRRRLLLDGLALLAAVSPLGVLAARGALRAPLWMDEVNYLVYALDWSSRQAGSGRPVTAFEGIAYSLFSYPNLIRPYLAALREAGVDPWRAPEVLLRLPSLLAVVAVAATTVAAARWRGRTVAALAAAAVSATPLFQFHASEARVYALAGAAALAYALLARGALRDARPARLMFVAGLGALLPYLSIWCAPLLAGLPLGWWWSRRSRGEAEGRPLSLAAVLAVTLPGLAVALLQLAFLRTAFAYQSQLRYAERGGWGLPRRVAESLWSGPSYLEPAPPALLVLAGAALLLVALGALVLALLRGRLGRGEAFLPLQLLAALVLLLVAGGVSSGFVSGRYEVPVMLALFAALAQLPRRLAAPLLASFAALGLVCMPWTLQRIAGKSSTRAMVVEVARLGEPSSELLLTRDRDGWDPLHRYPAWLYLCRQDPRWRCRTYPTLAPLGEDFMLLGTVAATPHSRRLEGDEAVPLRAWLRAARPSGVWVLAPETEDPRRLDELLRGEGYRLSQRRAFAGYPESWLLRYRR